MLKRFVLALAGVAALAGPASAERRKDLNEYVLAAVEKLNAEFGGQGYDSAYYTHDLPYGSSQVPASAKRPRTMCVAAVAEVLVTAIQLYSEDTHDQSVFAAIPARSWAKASRRDIRPYIFMFRDTVDSLGTGDALQQFGIGEELTFEDLVPGDFINFNRNNRTGHAVVFLGYIDAAGDDVPRYERATVVGFRYFSAQGRGAGSGLGYRWAYFDGKCPAVKDPARPRDCGVIRSSRRKYLNTGYLLHPSLWTAREAAATLETRVRMSIVGRTLGRPARPGDFRTMAPVRALDVERRLRVFLDTELPEAVPMDRFDGATTD